MATATLKSYNQSPRKVRLVADLITGKKVPEALAALSFLPKRAAEPIVKLVKSAVASAKGWPASSKNASNFDDLIVRSVTVNSAGMLKKYMPRARSRASLIRRRKSQITVTVS